MSSNVFEVNCLLILFLSLSLAASEMKMSEDYLKSPRGQRVLALVLSSISAPGTGKKNSCKIY